MNEIDTNSTETKATGIGQYFAGKTILQIIFGSAVWACVLGFVLFIVGQTVMYLVLAVIGRAAGLFSSDIWNTAILYLAFFGVWISSTSKTPSSSRTFFPVIPLNPPTDTEFVTIP